MNGILFEICKFVLIIAVMICTRYLVPWIRANTDMVTNGILMAAVRSAVQSAQQTITAPDSGAEKKAIVTEYLRELLMKKKITITDRQLDALIEAAVYAMKQEAGAAREDI